MLQTKDSHCPRPRSLISIFFFSKRYHLDLIPFVQPWSSFENDFKRNSASECSTVLAEIPLVYNSQVETYH